MLFLFYILLRYNLFIYLIWKGKDELEDAEDLCVVFVYLIGFYVIIFKENEIIIATESHWIFIIIIKCSDECEVQSTKRRSKLRVSHGHLDESGKIMQILLILH